METAKKLDIITIEDKHNLSSHEIFQRANEIAQTRGFENGWEISEIRMSGPVHQIDGLNICRFDVFGFESSRAFSSAGDVKAAEDSSGRSVAAPPAEV